MSRVLQHGKNISDGVLDGVKECVEKQAHDAAELFIVRLHESDAALCWIYRKYYKGRDNTFAEYYGVPNESLRDFLYMKRNRKKWNKARKALQKFAVMILNYAWPRTLIREVRSGKIVFQRSAHFGEHTGSSRGNIRKVVVDLSSKVLYYISHKPGSCSFRCWPFRPHAPTLSISDEQGRAARLDRGAAAVGQGPAGEGGRHGRCRR